MFKNLPTHVQLNPSTVTRVDLSRADMGEEGKKMPKFVRYPKGDIVHVRQGR